MPVVVINNFPSSISVDEFNVDVTITGAKPATNYLRIELYKEGSTNYFGETFNGKDWYSGSDGTSYFPVEINYASTSASVKARLGNATPTQYSGPGNYKLKIKRYTASGNQANDTESPVDILINYNLETPTPLPSSPTKTSIPTQAIIATPIPSPSNKVLAKETIFSPTPSKTPLPTSKMITKNEKVDTFPIISASIFACGLFLVGIGVYLLYNKLNAHKNI